MEPSTEESSDASKKKISLSFTPTKLQSTLNNFLSNEPPVYPEKCPESPTQTTDHFLNIVPKPTLLGKQQAKKRLQAFGLGKFSSPSSPVLKKTPQNVKQVKPIEVSEEKFDENGTKIEEISIVKKPPKKSDDYQKKAKEIIEEIENLKKISFVKIGANVKYLNKSRSKSPKENKRQEMDSKSSSRRQSEERRRCPTDWEEIRVKKLSLEDVKDIEKSKKTTKPTDAIKMLLFPTPPIIFNHLKYKNLNGQEDASVPPPFIRYTKATPKISYSCNYNRIKSVFFSRKQILDVISREQKKSLKQFIATSTKDQRSNSPRSPMKIRPWYSKVILTSSNNQNDVLESSLGGEDGEKNELENADKFSLKRIRKEEKSKKKLKKAQRKLKKLKKKNKKKHESSSSSNSESEVEDGKLTELFPEVLSKDSQGVKDFGNELVATPEKKVGDLYDVLNESEKSNHSGPPDPTETVSPKSVEAGHANFTNFLIKTSILKGTELKIENSNALITNPKPLISSDIDFKKIYSISTEIKLQNDLAATKMLKSTNLERTDDDSFKAREEKGVLNSLKVYSDADVEDRRRSGDAKHRRDDDRYRKDDDRYRKDDDRYRKDDRHRRDDDRYRRDDDRYRRDDKYRKDDDRHRRDDRHRKDEKYKRDEDKRRDDDRSRKDDSRHRRDEDKSKKYDDRHKADDGRKRGEEKLIKRDDRHKKDDKRKDDYKDRKDDSKGKYDDKLKRDEKYKKDDCRSRKDDRVSKDDKKVDSKIKKDEERNSKKDDKSKIKVDELKVVERNKSHETKLKSEDDKKDDRNKKDEKVVNKDDVKRKTDGQVRDGFNEIERKSVEVTKSEDLKHESCVKKDDTLQKLAESVADEVKVKVEPPIETELKNGRIFDDDLKTATERASTTPQRSSSIDIPERKRKSSKSLSPKCSKSRPRSESLNKESSIDVKPETSNKRILTAKPKKVKNKRSDDTGTPDTEEYHSHWESEEESESPCKKLKNNSWESDEEESELNKSFERVTKPRNTDLLERSLEMPLNINLNRSREKYKKASPEAYKPALFEDIEHKPAYTLYSDAWERGKYLKFRNDLEIQALEEERRSISEERKKLELEKQRIAEMGRRLRTGEIYDADDLLPVKLEPNAEQRGDDSPGFLGVCKSSVSYSNKRLQTSRWEKPKEEVKNEVAQVEKKTNALEDEYEQFMRAVTDTIDAPIKLVPEPPDKYNSCSSSSDYSDSTSTNSSSSNSSSDSADTKTSKIIKFIPLPVPSPPQTRKIQYVKDFCAAVQSLTKADSTSSPIKVTEMLNCDSNLECPDGIDLENRKPISTIILSKRPNQLLENSVFKDSDDSDTEKTKLTVPEILKRPAEVAQKKQSKSPPKLRSKEPEDGFNYRRETSPKRRRSSPGRRNVSPRRSRSPGRSHSPSRRHHSPQRGHSPSRKRRDSPRRRYRDSPSRRRYSPRRGRESPPRYREHRNRSLSPYRRRYSRSLSKERKPGNIQQTLQRIAGMDQFDNLNKSPVNSPLDGFKRSIADSTISDEQLLQNQEQYIDTISPFYNTSLLKPDVVTSPKRIPLDDRINQVLGIEKEEPKPISTTYSQNYPYNPQYYSQYEQYTMDYEQKAYQFPYDPVALRSKLPLNKVVQVGNVLQVVPTEDINNTVAPEAVPKEAETTQRILQVGNMLQIVPTTLPLIEPVPPPIVPVKEKQSAEDLMKEKIAERKAEREKRRLERERRRKEKEKKRKEREKKKQMKLKLKTEEMIKKALYTELNQDEDDEDVQEEKFQWPPVPVLTSLSRPVGKSIMRPRRDADGEEEVIERPKKEVKFADGVIPGEGTSPSGGEELSSPPPVPIKLPKERRFTKTKKPKKLKLPKKKNKGKMRKLKRRLDSDDEEEEDFLPPPSPPPGSPPPHIFPPRIKSLNNLKPNFLGQPRPVSFPFPPLNCRPPPIPEALQQPPPSITCRPPPMPEALQQPPAINCRPPPMPEALQQPPPFLLHSQNVPTSHPGVSTHHPVPPPHHRLSQSKSSYNVSISPSNPHHHHGAHHG